MTSARAEIYLDYNATAPMLPAVWARMDEVRHTAWGNPASVHAGGRRARAHLDECRETLAAHFAWEPRDVFLTSGGTEANNLGLAGARFLVTSRLEHPSVVQFAEHLASRGTAVTWMQPAESGRIEPAQVREALLGLGEGTVVAVMAVNHETGVINPVPEIAGVCRDHGARLHVDAVQAVGRLSRAEYLGADSYSVAAHKVGGPKGIGALLRRGAPPEPVLRGGAQERGYRPGTQDATLAAGFQVAAEGLEGLVTAYAAQAPQRALLETLLAQHGTVNGTVRHRAPHVTNVSLSGWSGPEFVAALDLEGVLISSGSACSAGTSEPSPVITAMVGRTRAAAAIRVSFGPRTTADELERAKQVFHRALTTRR